jgi:hypothetical protein
VMLVGGTLMAADTHRFGRRHGLTHGVDDRAYRRRAGGMVTVTT